MTHKVLIFFTLSVCSAFAQSQPPVPSEVREKWQPPQNESRSDQKIPANVTSGILLLPKSEGASDKPQNKAQDNSSKWRDPVTWFTGLLVVVGLFQIRVYLRQNKTMKRSLAVTRQAADHSKLATELCERADLQVVDFRLIPPPAPEPSNRVSPNSIFSLKYVNYGRTTADEIIVSVKFYRPRFPTDPCLSNPTIIAPGGHSCFEVFFHQINNRMTVADYDRINDVTKELFFVVRIEYFDVFRFRNWVEYSARYDTEARGIRHDAQRGRDKKD